MKLNNHNKINVFDLEKEYEIEDKFRRYFKTQEALDINIDYIFPNPFQPRSVFDDVKLEELSNSIKEFGIISPILLRKINDKKYEILAGERRVKAAEMAGLKNVPAIIGLFNDQQMMEISIIENIQREQLNSMEEALAFNNLSKIIGLTNDEIAKRIGKSRPYVANTMRLLTLPNMIQEFVINGVLTMGHVKPLIGLAEEEAINIANEAIENGLSVRQVENLANLLKGRKNKNNKKEKDPYYEYASTVINKRLGAKVRIMDGMIKIYSKNQNDLKVILDRINK